MARADEFNKSFEKPADRYIEWASDDKQFKYWDSEKEEEVLIPIPFKFIVLLERHTIKGFHDDSNSRIWSNEVEDLGKEKLVVKSFEGGLIAKGLYSDIKEMVKDAGGHYAKSVYILTEDGEVWNVSFKGTAAFAWGELMKKERKNLINHSVSVTDATDHKKGKIEYSIPVFELGKKIPAKALKAADEAWEELMESLSARAQSLSTQSTPSKEDDDEEEDVEFEEESEIDFDMPDEAKVEF